MFINPEKSLAFLVILWSAFTQPMTAHAAANDRTARTNQPTFNERLAFRWAPIHYQDVDQTGDHAIGGRSDYITAIDFDKRDDDDGWDTNDSWDNIAKPEYKAAAHIYYSVVATKTHWYILYAFFHPRDWTDNPIAIALDLDEHNNDLEGFLAVIKRPTAEGDPQYGKLMTIVTAFHTDFYSYTPEHSPFKNGREDINGKVHFERYLGEDHPVTAQEAKGHGLKAWPYVKLDGDGIKYFPSLDTAGVPTGPDDRKVQYKLIDIFAPGGLWDHRDDKRTFDSFGAFRGGGANAPWGWDDGDDGPVARGEIAINPATLVKTYFSNLGEFSDVYESNPYQTSQTKEKDNDKEILPPKAAADLQDGELYGPIKLANAWGAPIYYVNGLFVAPQTAAEQITTLAACLGRPVFLIFNDLTAPWDVFSTSIEKAGDSGTSVNKATATLIREMRVTLESGRDFTVCAHSAGVMSVQNAVNQLVTQYNSLSLDDRNLLLARIHVVTLGGASFDQQENILSDGWPEAIGSLSNIYDTRDGVASVFGFGCLWDTFASETVRHGARYYMRFLDDDLLNSSMNIVIDNRNRVTRVAFK